MRVPYSEDLASSTGPELCLDDPRGRGEALAGGGRGGLLSSEMKCSRVPVSLSERTATWTAAHWRAVGRPGGVIEPGVCSSSMYGNREILVNASRWREPARGGCGRPIRRTPQPEVAKKSDDDVVPKKCPNNGTAIPAEDVEGRDVD